MVFIRYRKSTNNTVKFLQSRGVLSMSNFLMKPKIDFAFKEIMANETIHIGFLAVFLMNDHTEINIELPKDIKVFNFQRKS